MDVLIFASIFQITYTKVLFKKVAYIYLYIETKRKQTIKLMNIPKVMSYVVLFVHICTTYVIFTTYHEMYVHAIQL